MLPPGSATWPELVRDSVSAELSEPVQLDSWRWGPFRPNAVPYALGLVDDAEPDLVILPLAAFWCAYSSVQLRMDQRFGVRTARAYGRAEAFIAGHIEQRIVPKSISRRVARRVLGVAPQMSLGAYIEVHTRLIQELSRREQLQLLVLADHHFNEENRRLMPLIPRAIARINDEIRPVVLEGRHLWGDMEEALALGGRREEMMLPDGVHMNEDGHQRLAAMVTPIASRFASSGDGRQTAASVASA